MLEIKNVTISYGDRPTVKNFSMTLKKGEIASIAGESGSGKTTVIRAVLGLLPGGGKITGGDILFEGKSLLDNTAEEWRNLRGTDMSMIFQDSGAMLNPIRTIGSQFREYVRTHSSLSKKEAGALSQEMLERMGLSDPESILGAYPFQLSGGQRQRVALARAIVGKPSILLMDEPLSALDAELKIEMRREIQNIHKLTGATILYVTHDQSEALAMADRIIIMKDGAVEQVGTPREIYMDPQTVFAATFVSRCNLLKGSWHGDSFRINNENILLRNPMIPAEFRSKGLYPVRPEQLTIQPEGEGIPGVIANKQYNGREIHYSIQYRDEILTVYTSCQTEYNPGDHISLTLSA